MKHPSAVELVVLPALEAEARAAADRCDAEREQAAEKALAAEDAAARCVSARDNADAAARVARASRLRFFYRTALSRQEARARRHTAALAARKADADHDDARSAAEAAALAAREASIQCAAACRDAVAAASAARKAVGLYVVAGGDADAADVFRAREAADLCIAVLGAAATKEDRAAAAELVVPRADAVAKAAREAAASCEKALADSAGDDDKKFLDSMRGWLMTVAALLVNMTFTAVLHPPSWVPLDFGFDYLFDIMLHRKAVSAGANSPAAAPSPGPAPDNTSEVANKASIYLLFNTVTFAAAISVVVALLKMETSAKTLRYIRFLMRMLAFVAACSFAWGTSKDSRVVASIFGIVFLYVSLVLLQARALPNLTKMCIRWYKSFVG